MKKSIYYKFIILYLLFAVLGFIFVSTKVSDMILDQLTQEKAEELYQEANHLSSYYAEDYYRSKTTSSLENIHKHLSSIDFLFDGEIWMLNIDGKIVAKSQEPLSVTAAKNQYLEDFDPAENNTSYYRIGDFYGKFSEEMLSVMTPIHYNYRVRGYLSIHIPTNTIHQEAEKLLNISYVVLGVLLLLSLIVFLSVCGIIYYPLKKIQKGADEFASGNLSYEIPLNTQDELGRMAASMNYMANELGEFEAYQKKFIANISHDFRSPLTSIKGYVEAMMDGTIPVELQEKYFKIVLFETDRLNKLTRELLALNTYNVKQGMLDISEFDINAVIKTTAASFEGRCRERRITLELLFENNHQKVKADMGKIQQVLYNLIDNAIKFSQDQSSITIETTVKYEKVFISVKDCGIGIPKEDLKKIWERFYKTDPSRGKDKRGTGLGLSIVKEIIQSHGENINVVSTEGVGTEFTFSLPKV